MLAVEDDTRFADWARAALGAGEARLGPLLGGGNANVTRLATVDGAYQSLAFLPLTNALLAFCMHAIRLLQIGDL